MFKNSAADCLISLKFYTQFEHKNLPNCELENIAIANALQLEASRRRAVPLRFNFVARAKVEVARPIRCRLSAFLLLIRYVTL